METPPGNEDPRGGSGRVLTPPRVTTTTPFGRLPESRASAESQAGPES